MVELLLKNGANIDARDKLERRAVHWAAFGGHWDVLRMLVVRGADPTARDKDVISRCSKNFDRRTLYKIIISTEYQVYCPELTYWQTEITSF